MLMLDPHSVWLDSERLGPVRLDGVREVTVEREATALDERGDASGASTTIAGVLRERVRVRVLQDQARACELLPGDSGSLVALAKPNAAGRGVRLGARCVVTRVAYGAARGGGSGPRVLTLIAIATSGGEDPVTVSGPPRKPVRALPDRRRTEAAPADDGGGAPGFIGGVLEPGGGETPE